MGLAHFKILIFFRLFKYGGRVGKILEKFCHPLPVANFSMRLAQNSMRYVYIMTFESILGVFCSRQVCFKELKIKLILVNLKYDSQRSHSEACSLKKCTLPYIYFVIKCLMFYFGIKKEWLEKKFEYFFIGSEHP